MSANEVEQLDCRIMAFVGRGLGLADEARFNELALEIFALQFARVKPYQEYCRRKGATPATVTEWRQIPAVPAASFKSHNLASFPLEKAVQSNVTSGTTGRKNRGKVYRDEGALRTIVAANGLMTREHLFPDVERMKILFLVPSPKMAPGMGMAIGMEEVRRRFGTAGSAFLVERSGLDAKALLAGVVAAEREGTPLALIGATSALIYFFKACEQEGLAFRLPPGSRVCDGGGYLGQFGECTKGEYFRLCQAILGVPPSHCVNVLGTAESSTNFFDNVLRDHCTGRQGERYKEGPPWTRTIAVDPASLEPVADGAVGLLKHYDLANRAMVLGVQTDNLGMTVAEGGFEILGRWSREHGAYVIGYAGGMPSGKVFNLLTDYLMTRKVVGLRRMLAALEEANG